MIGKDHPSLYSLYEITNFVIENYSQISSTTQQCLPQVGSIIQKYVFMYLKQTKEVDPKSSQYTNPTALVLSRMNKQISGYLETKQKGQSYMQTRYCE